MKGKKIRIFLLSCATLLVGGFALAGCSFSSSVQGGMGETSVGVNQGGHAHGFSMVEERPAECDEDGVREHWFCSDCGGYQEIDGEEVLYDGSIFVIPATGHNFVEEEWSIDEDGHQRMGGCDQCGDALPLADKEEHQYYEVTEMYPICSVCLDGLRSDSVVLDGVYYKSVTDKDGTHYAAAGRVGEEVDLVIRSTVNDLPVTEIDGRAFTDHGDYDYQIWNEALKGAPIESIVIPSSVTEIGHKAFAGCRNLTSVTFEENSQLTTIDSQAFGACSRLESITIPKSVTALNYNAFGYCTALSEVVFEEGSALRVIGENAFESTALVSIVIPKSVEKMNNFGGCANLTTVTFEEGSVLKKFGNHSDSSISFSPVFNNCPLLTVLTLPEGVEEIAAGAFFGTPITEITIPRSVTYIGRQAFFECASLTKVTFAANSSLEKIGNEAFSKTGITSLTIPKSVTTLNYRAFADCEELTEVSFEQNSKLTSFGSGGVFRSCEKLERVYIPVGVETIARSTFAYCPALTDVTFAEGSLLKTIETWAFEATGLTSIMLPESLETIDADAFNNCTQLVDVKLLNENTAWNDASFSGCHADLNVGIYIEYIEFDNGYYLEKDNEYVFVGLIDKNAEYIVVKSGTTKIAANALEGCNNLRLIYIPDSCDEFEENALANTRPSTFTIFWEGRALADPSTFEGTVNDKPAPLPHLVVESASITADGFIYTTTNMSATIWGYASTVKDVVVPSSVGNGYGVEAIAGYAFANTKIDSISISGTVAKIGGHTQITTDVNGASMNVLYPHTPFLGSTVKTVSFKAPEYILTLAINENAFAKAALLETVTFSTVFETMEYEGNTYPLRAVAVTIATNAFLDCPSLKSVALPLYASLYADAFSGTTTLEQCTPLMAEGYQAANICDVTVSSTGFTVHSREAIDGETVASPTALAAFVLANKSSYFEFGGNNFGEI